MKKLLFLLLGITILSCNNDDDYVDHTHELLPIASHSLPTQLKRDSIHTLEFQFNRPTTCHVIEGFYYDKFQNKRTIAIATSVLNQNNCEAAPINPLTRTLNFTPTTENSYVFKLWKGKDTSGQDIYEEIEIPVVP